MPIHADAAYGNHCADQTHAHRELQDRIQPTGRVVDGHRPAAVRAADTRGHDQQRAAQITHGQRMHGGQIERSRRAAGPAGQAGNDHGTPSDAANRWAVHHTAAAARFKPAQKKPSRWGKPCKRAACHGIGARSASFGVAALMDAPVRACSSASPQGLRCVGGGRSVA